MIGPDREKTKVLKRKWNYINDNKCSQLLTKSGLEVEGELGRIITI